MEENGKTKPDNGAKSRSKKVPVPPKMVSIGKLFSMADRWDTLLMIFGTLGAVLRGSAFPVNFILFGEILQAYGSSSNSEQANEKLAGRLYEIFYAYLALGVLYMVAASLEIFFLSETACWMYSGERQLAKLRMKYIELLLSQEVGYFDTDGNTAHIISCITDKTVEIQNGMGEKIGHGIGYLGSTLGSLIVAAVYSWQLALLTLIVVPVISVAGASYQRALANCSIQNRLAYSNASSIIQEALSQIRTVYSYVGEITAVKSFSEALTVCVKHGSRAGLAKGLGQGFLNGTMTLSWALLFFVGGILVTRGDVRGDHAIIAGFCVIYGGLTFGLAVPDSEALKKARAVAYSLYEIIERVPNLKDSENSKDLDTTKLRGELELRNVHFSYPSRPGAPIFSGLSLCLDSGRSLAVVGPSGGGKTTIISLLARFYDPGEGQVLLDGNDLKDITIHSLRRCIGLVDQEPALFSTTVMENLRFGQPGATDEQCIEAAKAANAHSFVTNLPDGYNTNVGERGTQLSGGQKQRIAIGRAVLRNPKILLLDEATSALDAESEKIVQEALDTLILGRTCVVVAHRLSTVRNVDSIAVLGEGKIVERGSRSELLSRGTDSMFFRLLQNSGIDTSSQDRDSSNLINSVASSPPASRLTATIRDSPGKGNPTIHRLSASERLRMSPGKEIALSEMTKPDRSSDVDAKDTDDVESHNFSTLKELARHAAAEWHRLLVGLLGSVMTGATKPFAAYVLVKSTIVYVQGVSIEKKIRRYCSIYALLGVFTVMNMTVQHSQLMRAGETITKNLRERVFAAILKNEMGWFDREENTSATITGGLAADSAYINTAISSTADTFIQNASAILFAIGICIVIEWRMTLVCISLIPLFAYGSSVRFKVAMGFSDEVRKSHSKTSALAAESVTNIRTVASFTMEKGILAHFNKLLGEPMKKGRRRAAYAGFLNGTGLFLSVLGLAIAVVYMAAALKANKIQFTSALTVWQIMSSTSHYLSEVMIIIPAFVQAKKGMINLSAILNRKTKIDPDDAGGRKPERMEGLIEFKEVHFRYPTRLTATVLSDLNLTINAGETVALVGESGSGKSSIISLVERFYDPTSGTILIDGLDLKAYNLIWVRARIGLVQQEPALFNTTIKQNIAYGNEAATEAEIIEAAKAANAHNFISSMPEGYDTGVGDSGSQLSGGQKQRIAIARAILKNPSILLLDEATSSLDTESEQIVQQALDNLVSTGSRTTLIVAHRLSTIQHADLIAVMSNGKLVEQGNNDSLVSKGGLYARLVAFNKSTDRKSKI